MPAEGEIIQAKAVATHVERNDEPKYTPNANPKMSRTKGTIAKVSSVGWALKREIPLVKNPSPEKYWLSLFIFASRREVLEWV